MRTIIIFLLAIISSPSLAIDIASCSNPSGKAYYPEIGLISKKNSGWTDDKISNGIIKLTKDEAGKYDILFVDTSKEIKTATGDGGTVFFLNSGENNFSLLVVYPGTTAEVYTFLKNKSGINEYIHITSRGGRGVLISKGSLMRGDCDYIDFSKVE